MPQWLEVVGRFHPLILHLPIGLLIGLGAMELVGMARRRPAPVEAARLLAWMGAACAALGATTGFILSYEDAYVGDTVTTHMWLGISVAVGAILVALLHTRKLRALYLVVLVLTLGLLVPTGHFGSVMTHGEGFILKPLRAQRQQETISVASASVEGLSTFEGVVAPIFQARCVNCHGPAKEKGGLRLDTRERILAGGDLGPVLVAGDSAASEMVRRLRLPLDDDDHMPPKSKPQPKAAEILAIEAWIAAGAPFDGQVAGIGPLPGQPEAADAAPPKPTGPAPAPPGAIAALRDHFVHVQRLSAESNLLWIDFAGATGATAEEVRSLLDPVREQVSELSLARCAIGSEVAPVLAAMPNLRRLDLRATAATDETVEALRSHARLEELVLAQTRLSDAAAEHLLAMPALRRVHLWKSGVSLDAARALREGRPTLEVDVGDQASAAAVETEPEIKLTSEAAAPGPPAPSAGGAAAALEPINKTCPVSGSPVDPKFAVVHEGRVVGFCCANCPGQFWAEPEKFEAALPK